MQGLGWIAAIFVGGMAGWIGSRLMGANTGILMNIILGIVGAVLANFLFRLVGISTSPTWISQGIAALVGACLLIVIVRMIRR